MNHYPVNSRQQFHSRGSLESFDKATNALESFQGFPVIGQHRLSLISYRRKEVYVGLSAPISITTEIVPL